MEEYKINNKIFKLNVFKRVRDNNDSYLLGYLSGDGGINKGTHKRNARLFVSSIEYDVIKSFCDFYCPDNLITSKIPINKKRGIKSNKESYILNFSSKFSEAFKNHGILCLKKDRDIVGVKNSLMIKFIHGLFDADGAISWGRRKDRDRLWANFVVTHQSLKLLNKVQNFLLNEFEIATSINIKKNENCFVLRTSRMKDIAKLHDIIYNEEMTLTYNKNKEKHYLKFLNEHSLMPPKGVKIGKPDCESKGNQLSHT